MYIVDDDDPRGNAATNPTAASMDFDDYLPPPMPSIGGAHPILGTPQVVAGAIGGMPQLTPFLMPGMAHTPIYPDTPIGRVGTYTAKQGILSAAADDDDVRIVPATNAVNILRKQLPQFGGAGGMLQPGGLDVADGIRLKPGTPSGVQGALPAARGAVTGLPAKYDNTVAAAAVRAGRATPAARVTSPTVPSAGTPAVQTGGAAPAVNSTVFLLVAAAVAGVVLLKVA